MFAALSTASDSRPEVSDSSNLLLNYVRQSIGGNSLCPILNKAISRNDAEKLQITALEFLSDLSASSEEFYSHSNHIKGTIRKLFSLMHAHRRNDMYENPILAIVLALKDVNY